MLRSPVIFRSTVALSFLAFQGAFATLAAQSIRVTNAASFAGNSVAPGSIISLFGANFSSGIAGVTDPSHPPLSMNGVSVTIGGSPASLFFVSPNQINAVVNPATPLGTDPVVVTSSTGTFTGSVVVDNNAPPGLFSLFGTGTRDGAIQNALTYQVGAFSTITGTSATYLSLYATGVNLSSTPVVSVGGINVPVQFAGNSPCCVGLQQINIQIPDSLAGSGRVPVVLQANGQVSNVVEIVLLPRHGEGEFSDDQDNQTRSREIAGLATIPNTSLALVTDENDDVVRVIDIGQRQVIHTIALPSDSEPVAVAVNADGTLAVVAERNRARVAILDLTSFVVLAEIPVGGGPVSVAVSGSRAIVVNGDDDTVTLIDLNSKSAVKSIAVGREPRGVAIDSAAGLAYVTDESMGAISVIDINSGSVVKTINLGATVRPANIQLVSGTAFALVTDASSGSNGKLLAVNLASGTVTILNANPQNSGGASDLIVVGNTAYVASQTGGLVSVLPLQISGASISGTPLAVNADLGARAIAIDTKDHLLLVTGEATGNIILIDLGSNQIVGRINAVRSAQDEGGEGEGESDDHSDRDHARNLPSVVSISPQTGRTNTTFVMTVNGTNLNGATDLIFVDPSQVPGNGKRHGKGNSGNHGFGVFSLRDGSIAVSNVQVNAAGTQVTATVTISGAAVPGTRLVWVVTPNGETPFALSNGNTFTVTP